MIQKKFNDYMETITPTNRTIDSFIGIEKVINSYDYFEKDLIKLNGIIDLNIEKMKDNIKELFLKDKKTFSCLLELIAVKDGKTIVLKDNQSVFIKDLLGCVEDIIVIFQESGLFKMIANGQLTSFNNYFLGVMVGMDTHARKNRSGTIIENLLTDNLKTIFLNNSNIIIEYESYFFNDFTFNKNIDPIRNKRFDIVIKDNKNNHIYLIENSYYNAGGSKISETAKSYVNIYNLVKDIHNITFIWIADGNGIKTIKQYLFEIFAYGFIININQFNRKMYKLNNETK